MAMLFGPCLSRVDLFERLFRAEDGLVERERERTSRIDVFFVEHAMFAQKISSAIQLAGDMKLRRRLRSLIISEKEREREI